MLDKTRGESNDQVICGNACVTVLQCYINTVRLALLDHARGEDVRFGGGESLDSLDSLHGRRRENP